MKKNIFVFCHVPKAGGTTLANVIKSNYSKNQIITLGNGKGHINFKDLKKKGPAFYEDKEIILGGHLNYGIHKVVSKEVQVKYFTFLREPISRIISLYYYIKSNPNHHHYNLIHKDKISLKEYVNSDITLEIDNWMVRQLGNAKAENRQISNLQYQQCMKILENDFALVGIMENFNAELIRLAKILKWKSAPYYLKANVNKKKPKQDAISEDIIESIKYRNKHDINLYNKILNLTKEVKNGENSLISEFEAKNKLYNFPKVKLIDIIYKQQYEK